MGRKTKMEVITNNMYLDVLNQHKDLIKSTQKTLCHNQILLLDYDIYAKLKGEIGNSLYYIYKDSLPDYCSNRLQDFLTTPVCLKHLDLCVLTSV